MNKVTPGEFGALDRGLVNADSKLLERIADRRDDPDFWSSKTRDRSDSAHCLFQYPAMMVPIVQRRLLALLLEAQPNISSLYDPFSGSGTSLVSGMHFGLNVFGTDINPLAVLISRVRTAKVADSSIGEICQRVASRARADGSLVVETAMSNRTKWFKDDVAIELSRLTRAIRTENDLWVRRFLWVTLAETIRMTSNDRTSTYKLHARPQDEIAKRNLSPLNIFEEISVTSVKSFTQFRDTLEQSENVRKGRYKAQTDIRLADTRSELKDVWGKTRKFDALMTSPPYGDNRTTVTYGQHSFLPLNWIDLRDIDETVDLTAIKSTLEIDSRSLGGHLKRQVDLSQPIFEMSPTLRALAASLQPSSGDALSRLASFYSDFSDSIQSMLRNIRTNGYMIWTVGNRNIAGRIVQTDLILGEFMRAQGCDVVSVIDRMIHHKRMPDRNASASTMKEEKILLVRKK